MSWGGYKKRGCVWGAKDQSMRRGAMCVVSVMRPELVVNTVVNRPGKMHVLALCVFGDVCFGVGVEGRWN